MADTCLIRYQIDPFQRDAFQRYAEAWGLVGFDDLAACERYRTVLKRDAEGRSNFELAQSQRFLLREERTWLEDVSGTRNVARQVATVVRDHGLPEREHAPSDARSALTWSERRDHLAGQLAGQLADDLYQHFTAMGWLRRTASRGVDITVSGQRELLPRLHADEA